MPIQSGCLFCGDEPCAAHADKPKKQRSRKQSGFAPSTSTPTPIPTGVEDTSNEWLRAAPKKFEVAVARQEEVELTVEERERREAIRNLWPLLSPAEQARQYDMMYPPKSASLSKLGSEVRRSLAERDRE